MPKLNETLTKVFTKLGVDFNSAEAQAILSNPAIAAVDVSDAIATRLGADFFTKDAALQNPEIRSVIKAEVLNGVDADLEGIVNKFELGDEFKANLKKEDKTVKRLNLLTDTIAELTKKKYEATGKDKEALNTEITRLNKQVADTRTEYENKITEVNNARKSDKVNWDLDSVYNGLEYAMPFDKDINVLSAKAAINKVFEDKGIKFDLSEKGVKILTNEGTEYFENNVQVVPADFIKKTLTEKKMLKVSQQSNQQQNQSRESTVHTHNNSDFNEALNERMQTQK